MASDRTIRIILTGSSAGAVKAFSEAGAAAEKTETKFASMQKVGRGMSSLGSTMTKLAIPLVAVGGYAVKTAATFQQSMEMIRTQAGQSQTEVNKMSKAILNIAPSLGTSTTTLASALYHVESAGYHGAAALRMLKVAAEGAKVGNADLVDVTNAMDAATVSGIKGVQNYKQAMGALNATVGAGDMKMQDLADAMSTGLLGPMRRYGLSITEVGGALATFGDNNIRGQEAATKLQSAIRIMAAPSTAAAKALAGIHLGTTQLATDLHKPNGLVAAFRDLKQHLTEFGGAPVQQALTLTRAFGGRQSTGVQLLLGQLPRLAQKTAEVAKGATGFGAAWQTTQKNISFQWDKLKATSQVALVHLGDALMPLVTRLLPPLVKDLASVVKWFSHLPKPVLDVVIGFTAFLAIGGPILMFFGSLITAIGTVGAAMGALDLAFLADPVVLGIMAIVAAGVLMVVHFRQVREIANKTFNGMAIAARAVGHAISSVFSGIWSAVKWAIGKIIILWRNSPLGGMMGAGSDLLHGNIVGAAKSYVRGATFGLLHSGGPVRARYFDMGGPVGPDTVPGWLTPGEFVLNKATTSRIGVPALQRLNEGGGSGGGGVLTVDAPVILNLDGRRLTQSVLRVSLQKAARGPTSLVGGGIMTGGA